LPIIGFKRHAAAYASALAAGLALSACSLQSNQPIPQLEVPASFQNATKPLESMAPSTDPQQTSAPAAAAVPAPPVEGLPDPSSRWWRDFDSAELNELVDRTLTNNHDLKAAVHRIAQAEAQAGVQAGSLLPTFGLSGSGSNQSPDGGVGTRYTTNPAGKNSRLYQVGFTASYEFDFWGKNRAAEDSALAAAQSSLYDREALSITLVGQVVTAYLQYLASCDRLVVAHRNVDNMNHVLTVVKQRQAIGAGANIEIRQQATALAQAQATIPPLALQREQLRTQLAILLGELPGSFTLKADTLKSLKIPALPNALPSELLARRPDLRRAEANLVAADANIAQARAQLLPSFSLTAQRGVGAPWMSALLSPTAYFYSLTASVAQTIFDNGKSLSQIQYSKEVYGERVENYRQALLTALREVENALAGVRLTDDLGLATHDAYTQAVDAYDLSQKAFHIGNADYLTILDVERSRYQTEDNMVQADFERLNAMSTLYQSLGGGTEPEAPPPVKPQAAAEQKDAQP
jgi:NodT family efflux transporter outer membrane factor (OMF) lipoprotein